MRNPCMFDETPEPYDSDAALDAAEFESDLFPSE